jgi:HD-like signal output (HDOD) protein
LLKRFHSYPEVLKKANAETEFSFTAVEDALCSINHAMIGGLLAQGWWLPDNVSMAIRHHHVYSQLELGNNTVLSPSTKGLIATAQLAEHLFQHHTGLSSTQEWLKGSAACLNYLGLTDNDLELLYDTSATVIDCNE